MSRYVPPDVTDTLDLRGVPPGDARASAFERLSLLSLGQSFEIILDRPQELLLETLNRQMRGRMCWNISSDRPWRVILWHRDGGPATTVSAILGRDHDSLDRTLAHTLVAFQGGVSAEIETILSGYLVALTRHIAAENALANRLRVPPVDGRDPVADMIAEHETIMVDIDRIAALGDEPQALRAPFLALLSGALAKHEGKEEQFVFPVWDLMLARLPGPECDSLMQDLEHALLP
ncbi:MAG: hemerythrin domain-containing protein [Acidiferrobacteraceae bacterium]